MCQATTMMFSGSRSAWTVLWCSGGNGLVASWLIVGLSSAKGRPWLLLSSMYVCRLWSRSSSWRPICSVLKKKPFHLTMLQVSASRHRSRFGMAISCLAWWTISGFGIGPCSPWWPPPRPCQCRSIGLQTQSHPPRGRPAPWGTLRGSSLFKYRLCGKRCGYNMEPCLFKSIPQPAVQHNTCQHLSSENNVPWKEKFLSHTSFKILQLYTVTW